MLTTGTFLAAQVMRGRQRTPAGRAGEFPANALSASLKALGIDLARLQTNTPPRVDARTIDFSQTHLEPGSEEPLYFSFDSAQAAPDSELRCPHYLRQPPNPIYPHPYLDGWRPQLPCYSLHTNAETHRVVRENLGQSQVTPGAIEAAGPRYCPSFEEKLVRFPDKERHLFFLEPEGWNTGEVYVQGLFTGMPEEVQLAALRTMPALREVEILRPGYAIEYDAVTSGQYDGALASKRIEGLYTAGQINGTSGYEEAAAQGLIAGINAARFAGNGAVGGRGAVLAPKPRPRAAPRPGLHRRADRRPGHQAADRALSRLYLAGRVPAAAAAGQRRPAPDAPRLRGGPGLARAIRGRGTQAGRHRGGVGPPGGDLAAAQRGGQCRA